MGARAVTYLLGAVICVAMGMVSAARIADYRDELTLWAAAVQADDSDWIAMNHYGAALIDAGRLDDAERELQHALRLRPGYADANFNFATILTRRGDLEGALKRLQLAEAADPDDAVTQNSVGVALCRLGRVDEGVPYFRKALKIKPHYAEAQNNLARALKISNHDDTNHAN